MKILTVCERGNIRSVAAGYLLKDIRKPMGYDVLACGIKTATPETFKMLAKWADKILVVADEAVYNLMPERFKDKTIHCNIGKDVWGNPIDANLLKIVTKELDALDL